MLPIFGQRMGRHNLHARIDGDGRGYGSTPTYHASEQHENRRANLTRTHTPEGACILAAVRHYAPYTALPTSASGKVASIVSLAK